MSNKFDEFLNAIKLGEIMNKKEPMKKKHPVLCVLAIIGAIAAVAAIAYAVYRYMCPDYLEDFDDEFDEYEEDDEDEVLIEEADDNISEE
ncbi:MAG: hypothetical protein QM217_05915 [Bacillota bacterium]|jgi:hypothetical protein|nr:hypothetical protein [Bacillota bacterium]